MKFFDKLEEKLHNFFDPPLELKPRTVYFNYDTLPEEELDPKTGRPKNKFDQNSIRTTKYTPFSFIPKNIFFQFKNIANIYFLFLIILGAFQVFGVQSPGLAAVPLIVIVIITAIKDAFEDSRRTISDLELNNNPTYILSGIPNNNVDETHLSFKEKFDNVNSTLFVKMVRFFTSLVGKKDSKLNKIGQPRGSIETQTRFSSDYNRESLDHQRNSIDQNLNPGNEAPLTVQDQIARNVTRTSQAPGSSHVKFSRASWKDTKVGDLVRIRNNEEAPADMVILSTSDEDSKCFVETKNLDGETNLKAREGLHTTSNIKRSRDLLNYQMHVKSEAPNLDMYSYRGSLNWTDDEGEQQEPINLNNIILRGSTLRNTRWAIGLVLFTGHETKIMLNSGMTPSKRSRISKELNLSAIINFGVLFILCFISGMVNGFFYRDDNTSFKYYEFKAYASTPAANGVLSFFVAMILYQTLVPISLYISVEIIKTAQAYFIYSDVDMYYEPLDYPCTPKSWAISDDLGQIEYIFSDKTGTLTQNIMEFKKATVNGKSYGLAYTEAQAGMDKRKGIDTATEMEKWTQAIEQDKQEMVASLEKFPPNDQFDADKLTFISSEFIKDLAGEDEKQKEQTTNFMICLALCHTVLTEPSKEDPTKLEFKAESPDEAALVQAASDAGFTFLKRTRTGGVVRVLGEEKSFDILNVLAFNSTRKRMSVICRIDGHIAIITKGADSVLFARLDPEKNEPAMLKSTADCLEEYASEGLRTLCVAGREISEKEYQEWCSRYDDASNSLENREERMEELASEIESNLVLYGGTAIEDRLQIGVPESIERLGRAGIKLWVLTGDKIETAINIGFSCNLLGNNMELLIIRAEDTQDIAESIDRELSEYLKKFEMTGSKEELVQAKKDHSIPTAEVAVIIDGAALATVFESEALQRKFLLLCKQCKSVLCCRVSPSQKAAVVKLVRDSLDVMTLAIGDGANDVAMIQTANVGVGIIGEEGRQAAMSSDYALGQFRFLNKLVLVHGRWDYKRLAEMIPSFFYKNVVFTMILFWYGIYTNFDGSYLLEFTNITFFNLAYTSLPVIFLGIFDQDVEANVSIRVPQLYKTGILRHEWSQYKFLWYMFDGLFQSVISFFFPALIFLKGILATYNGLNVDHRFWIGVFTTHIAVTSCDLYVLLRQYRWDWLTLLIDALSILIVFFWTGVYSSSTYSGEYYKVAAQVYGTLGFWVVLVAGVIANLIPRFVYNTLQILYRPRDIDIIRECVARGDFDERVKEISSDEEKAISNDSSSEGATRGRTHSLQRITTSRDLPELTTAQSLVKTFTHASLKH